MSERLDTAYHRPFYGRRPVHLVSVQPGGIGLVVQAWLADMARRPISGGLSGGITCSELACQWSG